MSGRWIVYAQTSTFGGQIRENRQGKDLGGVKGYLEGIFANPSLTQIQGKTKKKHRKTKQRLRTIIFSLFFLSIDTGRIWGGLRAIWRVFLPILPLQKSKEKPIKKHRKTKQKLRKTMFSLFFLSIDKGRIFLGVKGCLEGIFANPSLTKIRGKTKKKHRKTKNTPVSKLGGVWGGLLGCLGMCF